MLAMVIGGSGSGKSEYAEGLAVKLEPGRKLYLATMYPWDEESKRKIERHRRMRAKKEFVTLECFYDLVQGIEEYSKEQANKEISTAFLDCMSNLVANELYCEGGYVNRKEFKDTMSLEESVLQGIDLLCQKFEHVVIVTNDVFGDGVVYDKGMQEYLRHLARINEGIAKRADLVVEVVCGIPVIQKGEKSHERIME